MAVFTAQEIIEAGEVVLEGHLFQQMFTGVSTDTRTLKPGDLFIALSGDRFDGHCFFAAGFCCRRCGFC